MTVRFLDGVGAMFDGVASYFAAVDATILVRFGHRERAKKSQGGGGANRIVFLPSDPSGDAGVLKPPRDVGRQTLLEAGVPVAEVRPLLSWERKLTISVWSFDSSAPRDEFVQAKAVVALFEKLVRAVEQVRGVGGPNLGWGAVKMTIPHENTFGAELLVSAGLIHPLLDAPADVGFPGFSLSRVGIDPE